MSSAALQTPAGLPTSARHYTTSPGREGYHASQQQQVPPTSSTSSSRPSRKSSGGVQSNGNTVNANSAYINSSGAYSSSPAHLSQTNSPMASRAAFSSPVTPSAAVAAVTASISDYPQPSPSASSERRRHRNQAPTAPPRTSSSRQDQQLQQQQLPISSIPPITRKPVGSDPSLGPNSPRRQRESRSTPSTPGSASREEASRRRQQQELLLQQQQQQQQQSVNQEYARRAVASGGSRSATTTTMPIRTQPGSSPATASSHVPTRETSEILNTMVVSSRDEVDVEREKARLAISHTSQGNTTDDGLNNVAPAPIVPTGALDQTDDNRRRSRHDYSKREKQIKFGDYILGNTIGEGEFGKVKLGWKQEGGVQVAIKLIKKDTLGNNPTRMAKIMREVNILKQLNHPNIVQLHKMEESEHHYGIVLEYASGGELFDYILKHRYLKDNGARRLFAQLISGVGYLHKKGIVHRDLKLENLLLDRNRNIIITDFGFANTFDPADELTEEEEVNLADRDWVKRMGFDRVKANGSRRADLMQTSCGSPCYAAPELVVSDSLYTGRKVDVWSCGVILYAMLAGYLPFDDDPKNPEGDNINLLYKYIVNTPLTFPEYVTPHARDLLRRILVPEPRQRADLFEVARHSWLSEYANVVEFVTSSTTNMTDIQRVPAAVEEAGDSGTLGRSSSVRESSKKTSPSPTLGGLTTKPGILDPAMEAAILKQQKENKRRTVQVEYVAPATQTQRGELQIQTTPSSGGKTRARSSNQGPIAVATTPTSPTDKPLPRDPPVSKESYMKPQRDTRRPPSSHRTAGTAAAVAAVATGAVATRANRESSWQVSDTAYINPGSGTRPVTGGSLASTGSRAAPNRASFGQPVPPTVAGTNAHGRIQQPPKSGSGRNYVISNPIPQDTASYGRPSTTIPPKFAQVAGYSADGENVAVDASGMPLSTGTGSGSVAGSTGDGRRHRRSNTIGDITDKILGRSGSLFGNRRRSSSRRRDAEPQKQQTPTREKPSRKYPPVSMSHASNLPGAMVPASDEPRPSMESTARQSRRSFSLGLGRKRSGSIAPSMTSQEKRSKRFSLRPGSFSLKSIGIGKDKDKDYVSQTDSQPDLPIQEPPLQADARYGTRAEYAEPTYDDMYTHLADPQQAAIAMENASPIPQQHAQMQPLQPIQPRQQQYSKHQRYASDLDYRQQNRPLNTSAYDQTGALHEVVDNGQMNPPRSAPYQAGYDGTQSGAPHRANSRTARVVLQKNKRMADAYDTDDYSKHNDRSGSSGAARRVMDFFRRRSKARGADD